MQRIRSPRQQGFSVLGVLVGVILLFILLTILAALPHGALLKGRVSSTVANGKAIYQSIFSQGLTDIYGVKGDETVWPRYGTTQVISNQFQTSTEFLCHMVTNGAMPVNFSFFAPVPVRPAQGSYQNFTHTNNGWCVVANVDEAYPDDAPVLFTKNLANFASMNTPIPEEKGWLAHSVLPDDPRAPFSGRDAFVFITKRGVGYGLHGDQLKHASFTNLFRQVDDHGAPLTNPILRP